MTFDDNIPREGLLALLKMATEFYMGQEPLVHGMTDVMRAKCYPDETNSRPVRVKFTMRPPSRGPGHWVVYISGGYLQRSGRTLYDEIGESARYPDATTAMEYYRRWRTGVLGWVETLELRPSKRLPECLCRVESDGHLADYNCCPLDLSFDTLMAAPSAVEKENPEPLESGWTPSKARAGRMIRDAVLRMQESD